MHRALAILKYLPAVLCGLLVVAWVLSVFCSIELRMFGAYAICEDATIESGWIPPGRLNPRTVWAEVEVEARHSGNLRAIGAFYHYPASRHFPSYLGECIAVPLPFLLTIFLPLASAPFTRFRFPLWSYFAWTALVAAELVNYLR